MFTRGYVKSYCHIWTLSTELDLALRIAAACFRAALDFGAVHGGLKKRSEVARLHAQVSTWAYDCRSSFKILQTAAAHFLVLIPTEGMFYF